MKKAYSEPLMEVVDIKMNQQLLAGSVTDITGNAGLDPTPLPGDGTGGSVPHAPLFDDPAWDTLLGN